MTPGKASLTPSSDCVWISWGTWRRLTSYAAPRQRRFPTLRPDFSDGVFASSAKGRRDRPRGGADLPRGGATAAPTAYAAAPTAHAAVETGRRNPPIISVGRAGGEGEPEIFPQRPPKPDSGLETSLPWPFRLFGLALRSLSSVFPKFGLPSLFGPFRSGRHTTCVVLRSQVQTTRTGIALEWHVQSNRKAEHFPSLSLAVLAARSIFRPFMSLAAIPG